MKRVFCIALLSALVGGCHKTAESPANQSPPDAAASPEPHHPPSTTDTRKPLPLLAHMAEHQREQMRDHLAAIQQILAALSTNDFAGIEKAASRIGYSEQMGRMCSHMGMGAPGFTHTALQFHRTADAIDAAAKRRDADATLKAVTATLQNCVSCHATYRQEIVDDAAWEKITKQH
jgi:cytochrome c556